MAVFKAVVFDAYGTLFDLISLNSLADELYPGKSQALCELWRRKQLEYTWLLSLMGKYRDFWSVTRLGLQYALETLGLPMDDPKPERLLQSYLTLPTFPEVRTSLLRLSQRYPLAVLSNGTEEMLEGVIGANHLEPYLSHVLSADAAGVYKPSSRVYDLAVGAFFAVPAEIVFVSANGWG
ncbi:MAG: haloacid dehalogenase type II, partial [Meiothermus sp.]